MTPAGLFSSRTWLVAAIAAAAMSGGCRQLSPVERHFLRMPADCAGGLSRIERARWLKHSRRSLPSRKTLQRTGYLVLPGTETKRGTMLRSLELLHISGGDGSGGLAVVTTSGTTSNATAQIHLLEHRRFNFTDVTDRVLGGRGAMAGGWRVSPGPPLITGIGARGTVVRQVTWDGRGWTAR
jgi:hypothetical protein